MAETTTREPDMPNDSLQLRASDHDREQVVDRLRAALEDGRLSMAEYVDRMGLAYQGLTYGDLAPLHADLPAADLPAAARAARRPAPGPSRRPRGPRPASGAACPRRSACCGRSGSPPCPSTWSSGSWSA